MPISDNCAALTFAAVGDLIYTRPFCRSSDPDLAEIAAILTGADVTFGNFEATIVDLRTFRDAPQAESGGSWLMADPGVAADLKAFGFDLLSHANNHVMDWGVEGLLGTAAALRAAGLTVSGSGATLSAARQPRYLDSAHGRIGFVSAASSYTALSRAADPVGQVPGRPGINPLRVRRIGVVSPESLAALARIYNARRHRDQVKDWSKGFNFMGVDYLPSDEVGEGMAFTFKSNAADITANLAALRQAKLNSDFVVFSIHNHQPGFSNKRPPNFVKDIARQAIDLGTDAVVIHGSHEIGPIEVYKRRPIFYSLGNFVFDGHAMDAFPADMYEMLELEPATPIDTVIERHHELFFRNPLDYKSILPVATFDRSGIVKISIFPVDLGGMPDATAKGRPRLARGEMAREILLSVQDLSRAFGTQIEIDSGVGEVFVQ